MKRTPHAPAVTWLTVAALLMSMCASLAFTRNTDAQAGEELNKQETPDARTVLSKYTIDLTRLASQRKLEAVEGFDTEIARVLAQLSRASAKAPVVVGESDADRGAIARGRDARGSIRRASALHAYSTIAGIAGACSSQKIVYCGSF